MADKEHIQRVFEDGTLIVAAIQRAFRQEIERKAKLGQTLVVWRDNRTVLMPAAAFVREKGWTVGSTDSPCT